MSRLGSIAYAVATVTGGFFLLFVLEFLLYRLITWQPSSERLIRDFMATHGAWLFVLNLAIIWYGATHGAWRGGQEESGEEESGEEEKK